MIGYLQEYRGGYYDYWESEEYSYGCFKGNSEDPFIFVVTVCRGRCNVICLSACCVSCICVCVYVSYWVGGYVLVDVDVVDRDLLIYVVVVA